MRRKLFAFAMGVAFAIAGNTAHAADTTPTRVGIYLANATRNPDIVHIICGEKAPIVHTAVFNDHPGNTGTEVVQVYREDGGVSNYQNWPVVAGPFTVPLGSHHDLNLAYGPVYNAVAIPAGNDPGTGKPYTFPKYPIDFFTMASHGTADNSQLFPPGFIGQANYEYPDATGCPTPTPPPVSSSKPGGDDNPCDGDKDDKCPPPNPCDPKHVTAAKKNCPTCPPNLTSPKAVTVVPTCPTATVPTETAPTSAASSVMTIPDPTTATTSPTATGTVPMVPAATPVATGPTLAHTGAGGVIPLAIGAILLGAAGFGLIARSKRATSRH